MARVLLGIVPTLGYRNTSLKTDTTTTIVRGMSDAFCQVKPILWMPIDVYGAFVCVTQQGKSHTSRDLSTKLGVMGAVAREWSPSRRVFNNKLEPTLKTVLETSGEAEQFRSGAILCQRRRKDVKLSQCWVEG
jgi:hypothetical protein